MITALQRWVTYKAKQDGISFSPNEFNKALERVCFGEWREYDLELLFEPIKNLFEFDPEADKRYEFYIVKENGAQRPFIPREMRYVMQPKRGLQGKASNSIGLANFRLEPIVSRAGGSVRTGEIELDNGQRKRRIKVTKHYIPEGELANLWRKRLLFTYFNKGTLEKAGARLGCALCGTQHTFENLRFIPPVNIFVEDFTNFTPYLSGKPAHSFCPYCVALMLRACAQENAPQMVPFYGARRLQLLVLPYDTESDYSYEVFSSKRAEQKLKEELGKTQFDALHFLLSFPLLISDLLPYSPKGLVKPLVYVALVSRGRAEEIINQFVVTRFDILARVGRNLTGKDIRFFGERLYNYVLQHRPDQRIHAYKDIFNFIEQMLMDGIIDFNFLKRVLRREISRKKQKNQQIFLYGSSYIQAFLKEVKEVG